MMEGSSGRLRTNCRKSLVSILVVVNTTFIGTAFGVDDFSIEVPLKEIRNEFSDDIEYEPTSLTINDNNEFCKTGQCTYEISDGKLSQNSYDSTLRSFDGILKVIAQEGDTKVTKLIPFNSEMSISEIRETGGKSVELLNGKLGFGKDTFNPDFEYEISNGTLTVQGQKATLHLSGNSTSF
jgi:hypothetical protein